MNTDLILGVFIGAVLYGLYDLIDWWRKGKVKRDESN